MRTRRGVQWIPHQNLAGTAGFVTVSRKTCRFAYFLNAFGGGLCKYLLTSNNVVRFAQHVVKEFHPHDPFIARRPDHPPARSTSARRPIFPENCTAGDGHQRRSARARRVCDAGKFGQADRGQRRLRTLTSRCAGTTGRSTSTSTTRASTRRLEAFEKRPESRRRTPRPSTTTTPTTARCGPAQARPGHRLRHRVPHRLDGGAAHPLRLHPGTRPREHPEPQEPGSGARERRLRQGPQDVGAVAGRFRRYRLEQGRAARRAQLRLATCGIPRSRAGSACSPRCATRSAASCRIRASPSTGSGATTNTPRPSMNCRSRSPTARFATSRATRTRRTCRTATPWPPSSGPETSPR